MINHNALEDRLEAIKSGQAIPEPPLPPRSKQGKKQEVVPQQNFITYKQFFINEGWKTFNVLSASILYGYGLKALFAQDWNFIGVLGIGFLLNHFLTIILKLFKKK